MEDNIIFSENPKTDLDAPKKQAHTASLVIGILSIVLGLLIALAGEILGVIGIVLARKNRFVYNTKAALICSIIGLVLSIINQILGIMLALGM